MADDPKSSILGPSGQAMSQITAQKMQAQTLDSLVKAYNNANKELKDFFKSGEQAGRTFEELAHAAQQLKKEHLAVLGMENARTEELRKFGAAANMSFDALRKLPLRDLPKGFADLARGMLASGNALASVGTAAFATTKTIELIVDALGHLRGLGASAALGMGDVGRAISPTGGDMRAVQSMRQAINRMGLSQADAMSAMAGLGQTSRMAPGQAAGAATSAAAVARLTGGSPEALARDMGKALQSGIAQSEWERAMFDATHSTKGFGISASEAVEATNSLFLANRAMGMGVLESEKAVKRFSGELGKGILTVSDLQNLDPRRRQAGQTMGLIQLAQSQGMNLAGRGITAQDPITALGQLMRMSEGKRVDLMQDMFSTSVKGLSAGGGRNREMGMRKILMESLGQGMPEGLQQAILEGRSLKGMKAISPVAAGESEAGRALRSSAEQVGMATVDSTKGVQMAAVGLKNALEGLITGSSSFEELRNSMGSFIRGLAQSAVNPMTTSQQRSAAHAAMLRRR